MNPRFKYFLKKKILELIGPLQKFDDVIFYNTDKPIHWILEFQKPNILYFYSDYADKFCENYLIKLNIYKEIIKEVFEENTGYKVQVILGHG